MFERVSVEVGDAVSCADVLVASIDAERRVVARRFASVAAWADRHCPESDPPRDAEGLSATEWERRLAARAQTQLGADGTPAVTRSGVVQLGMLLQISTGSAQALLRDVLELRHRLPDHWEAVLTGEVDGWKARQVATLTRRLSRDQARRVDGEVLDAVIGLPWGRAKAVVEGRVIAADRAGHQARLAEDENRKFVSTRRSSNAAGLRTLIARGHAGDIARLEAMIAHLAALLEAAGDSAPVDFRRAKALAMLANPALTCVFLAQAQAQAQARAQTQPQDSPTRHPDRPAPGTDIPAGVDTSDDAGAGTTAEGEPLFESDEAAPDHEPTTEASEPSGAPSAVELAVAFGRVLQRLGATALDRLRPRSVLYLHLAAEAVQGRDGCGVARVDDPVAGGPIGVDQMRAWLANDRVTVRPVLDPTGLEPVDGYEIPRQLREAVRLINPYETFPYGTLSARQADIDHPVPYVPIDEGGPPGQTALDNLGPLGRRHHLAKTFDGFTVHQLAIGLYLWRSPTGHWYQVDHRGTRYLGRYPGQTRPEVLETAERLDVTDDMSPMESRLRELILRSLAA